MSNKEYIESGILELYAAGALSPQERREVEQMLAQHKELRDELNQIEITMETFAQAHAKQPSRDILAAVLSEVEKGKEHETSTTKTIELNPVKSTTSNVIRYLAYAASLLLFVSIAINIYYYSNYQRVQEEMADMRDQNLRLADQNDVLQADYKKLQSDMDIVKSPGYMAVTMKGMPISPSSIAIVYWDKANGNVYINANNLPAPEAGKQYQLWALKGGQPIDMGVFDMNGDMQLMKNIKDADAFAVTLEPAGGSAVPTLEFLYVVGNV